MYVTFGDMIEKINATCQVLGMIAVTKRASLALAGELHAGLIL